MWNFFFIGLNRSSNQRSGMILEVQIQSFGKLVSARVNVFIFKKFQGPQILVFFVKIGLRLPFTIKNKNTNLKFEFKNYFIFTPIKALFGF